MNVYMTSTYISGPVNVARIEGEINGIKKTLYAFMDIHVDIETQTKCSDILADNFIQYLIKTVQNNKDTTYDFFMEVPPFVINRNSQKLKQGYIHETVKFFKQEFNFNHIENKILQSKSFPNMRMHYMDIRSNIAPIMYSGITDLYNIIDNTIYILDIHKINNIRYVIDNLYNSFIILVSSIFPSSQKGGLNIFKIPDSEDEIKQNISKFINKIQNKYDNANIKKIINDIINELIGKQADICANIFKEIYSELDSITKLLHSSKKRIEDDDIVFTISQKNVVTLNLQQHIKFQDLDMALMKLRVYITDMFFLRRFLDKKYITHGIVYTGLAHSCNYLYFLVKYFGFKVTHASYCVVKDLNILNSDTLNNKYQNLIDFEFLFFPEVLRQCSNMKTFPNNLS